MLQIFENPEKCLKFAKSLIIMKNVQKCKNVVNVENIENIKNLENIENFVSKNKENLEIS